MSGGWYQSVTMSEVYVSQGMDLARARPAKNPKNQKTAVLGHSFNLCNAYMIIIGKKTLFSLGSLNMSNPNAVYKQLTKKVCLECTSGADQIKQYAVFCKASSFVTEAAILKQCQERLLVQSIAVSSYFLERETLILNQFSVAVIALT